MKLCLKVQGYPEVQGVCVGYCKSPTSRRFAGVAHAHNYVSDVNFGWVCIRTANFDKHSFVVEDRADGFDGTIIKPDRHIMHEIAHIRASNHGHDMAWGIEMRKLGQPIPRRFRRLSRV